MGGGSHMQTVLVAPGVKGKKVLSFTRDGFKDKDAVAGLIRSIVAAAASSSGPAQRSAFHVLDLAKVVDLYWSWRRALPDVRPYYAVKCNPEPALLGALAALGAGFDCASRAEIAAVLALGVHPRSIVYANPCKPEPHLEYAADVGVNLTTYDSVEEVAKVKKCHPKCELLLRIKGPDGGKAKVDLSTKYGAHGSTWPSARAAFDAAVAMGMPPMRVLDIGGGFTAGAAFDEAAAVINDALAQHFGDLPCVEVIGEPGRYFAEKAFTLAARVIGKRARGEVREYWIDDGLYGSLNCILMDYYVPRPRPLATPRAGDKTYTSTVFGPTCDSLDTVVTGYQLPEMSVGDWLIFDDMGAYTTAAGSKFNGFDTSEIKIYVAYSN
ncbi:unnamed protein product [Urochloa decumbens]|uniref:ornithine decarboxylase n=1 Tax=Urochloa decumbens TaxID=240449 RepID=A0ABC9FVI8_9POAL